MVVDNLFIVSIIDTSKVRQGAITNCYIVPIKIVNFLDVTLDLTTGKYKPYNKPGNIPLYISVKSNYNPLNIIKNLPESISCCMNNLSSNKSVFDNPRLFI